MLTRACADPACDCKITYAPKKKPSGPTFHYYRCADGKRVHRGRGEPQVNVREEGILDQLGAAVDAVTLTEDIACSIAVALNETHRAATAACAGPSRSHKTAHRDHRFQRMAITRSA